MGAGLVISLVRSGASCPVPYKTWPYLVLLGLVLLSRIVVQAIHGKRLLALHGVQVDWFPLTSPVLPLALSVLVLKLAYGDRSLTALWGRVRRPLLTTLAFLILSQALVKTGLLAGAIAGVSRLDGLQLVPFVAAVGALAGYVTGFNIAGNAIVMPALAVLGSGMPDVLAAIQNSAAGLGAMGSLPMIALVAGIAKPDRIEERRLTRYGFVAALLGTSAVAIAGLLILLV